MSDYGTAIGPRTVQFERRLPGPVERVWDYLVDPEKRATWLAGGPMELRAGGAFEFVFHNVTLGAGNDPPPPKYAPLAGEVRMTGRVLECTPPHRLVLSWSEGTGDPSEVTFELSPGSDGVRLVVTHRKLASRDDMISVAGGWHTHLDILADRMEGRHSPAFWPTHTRLESVYDKRVPAE